MNHLDIFIKNIFLLIKQFLHSNPQFAIPSFSLVNQKLYHLLKRINIFLKSMGTENSNAAAAGEQQEPQINTLPPNERPPDFNPAIVQPVLPMPEKPAGNLRTSFQMATEAKTPDKLERSITNLRIIAGQLKAAVQSKRMQNEQAFADLLNSSTLSTFLTKIMSTQERQVSADYAGTCVQVLQVCAELFKSQLAAGKINEVFLRSMCIIFNPEQNFYRGYYQMTKEMREAYRPNQEHQLDPTQRPREERGRGGRDEQEQKLDNLIQHQTEGSNVVVYCLPREHECNSRRYIDLMNYFGSIGGFKILLGFIHHPNVNKFPLTMTYQMLRVIELPFKLYHQSYLNSFGEAFALRVKDLVLTQPLDQLKKLSNEQHDMFSNIVKDFFTQISTREQSFEPRMQMVKKFIESEALTLRRHSIKELNNVLQQAAYCPNAQILEDQITWMQQNGVFDVLWDARNTHVELVKQSKNIFDLLCRKNSMRSELLVQFWDLGHDPAYKSEVFKIIMECRSLQTEHLQMILNNIESTPPEKLSREDFEALAGNAKFKEQLKQPTIDFFWRVLQNSSQYKEDTVTACGRNFTVFTKGFTIEEQAALWQDFGSILSNPEKADSTIDLINFFQPQIERPREEGEKADDDDSDASYTDSSYEGGDSDDDDSDDSDIPKHLRNKKNKGREEVKDFKKIKAMLQSLGDGFVLNVATNIVNYCQKAIADAQNIVEKTHKEQIKKRFSFLEEFLVSAETKLAKGPFEQLYNQFSNSPMPNDLEMFFTWCAEVSRRSVLDGNQVFVFFNEKIEQNTLNMQGLPVDGFIFLRDLFVSHNLQQNFLEKYEPLSKHKRRHVKYSDMDIDFEIKVDPNQLLNYKMIWEIALQSANESVISKSIGLLVNCHVNLKANCGVDASDVLQNLISQIFTKFTENQGNEQRTRRLVRVLKTVIQISEKKGVNVQPHSALLRGEAITNLTLRYKVNDRRDYWSKPIIDREFTVDSYTTTTVWEFKQHIALYLGTHPRYLGLSIVDGTVVQDYMNGMTLKELNLKSNSVIMVDRRGLPDRHINKEEIIANNRMLTQGAKSIIKNIFNEYKDNEMDRMMPEQAEKYLSRACRKEVNKYEDIYKDFIKDDNGITESQFMSQYQSLAQKKPHRFYRHFKANFYGKDFQKMSEIVEPPHLEQNKMPRFTISANEEQFQALFNLTNASDAVTQNEIWSLIRMLATNRNIYDQVLASSKEADINWQSIFTDQNLYKQTYKQEIIFDIMETNSLRNVQKVTMSASLFSLKIKEKNCQFYNSQAKAKGFVLASVQDQIQAADKTEFSSKFQTQQGFAFILQELLNFDIQQITQENSNASNTVFFQLALLRNNIEQAKEQGQINDEQIGQLYRSSYKFLQTVLAKQQQQLKIEDKLIIDHAMVLVVKTIGLKNDLFDEFIAEASNAPGLLMDGLMNEDVLIRVSFSSGLKTLPVQFSDQVKKVGAIDYLFCKLGEKYFLQNDKRKESHLFLDLLNDLANMKADLQEGQQQLLFGITEQVIDSIMEQIKVEHSEKIEKVAPKNEVEEQQSVDRANIRETLLQDLILLMRSLLIRSGEGGTQLITSKDLLSKLLKDFLFPSYYYGLSVPAIQDLDNSKTVVLTGSRAGVKVKNINIYRQSRRDAYSLIATILSTSSDLIEQFILSNMAELTQNIKKPATWSFKPVSTSGTNQKYVGLVNLQNICYMNSILQQFFMIPAFRYNMLCVEEQPGAKKAKQVRVKDEMVKDDMLYQLQRLVANLETSERNDYNMRAFCYAYKEFNGKPTDHTQQKDSQEFLGTIIQRLEEALKPTTRKYLLNDIFGGKMCNQMVCPDCGKVKNRIEDSYFISVPIKGINSIQKSLEKYIEGDIISDYECGGCKKKVDIKKRALMSEMPNVMIVHLQRIAFSMETFQNEKINSYCEFPNILDMKPYSYHGVMESEGLLQTEQQKAQMEEQIAALTGQAGQEEELEKLMESKEPKPDDCYEYKLVGVNVHHGTADSGHYWSYINTNRQKPDDHEAWLHTENDPWMEFNDRTVSNFKFDSLSGRCFGNQKGGKQQGTSAYMLFYVRTQQKDLKLVVPDAKVQALQGAGVEVNKVGDEFLTKIPFMLDLQERPALTESLFRFPEMYYDVLQENKNDAFESDAYSDEFLAFIPKMLTAMTQTGGNLSEACKLASLEIGRKMSVEVMARIHRIGNVTGITNAVMQALKAHPEIARSFTVEMIDGDKKTAWNELFYLYDDDQRDNQINLIKMLTYCLCATKIQEKDAILNKQTEDFLMGQSTLQRPKSAFIRFLRNMKQVLHNKVPEKHYNAKAFLGMYKNLLVFSGEDILAGTQQHNQNSEAYKIGMKAFFDENMIQTLGHYMLQDKSPLRSPSKIRINGKLEKEPFINVIQLMVNEKRPECRNDFSEEDTAVLSSKDVMEELMQEGGDAAAGLMASLSKGNPKLIKQQAKKLVKSCSQRNPQLITQALGEIWDFLKTEDNLKAKRYEWIFGTPQMMTRPDYQNNSYFYGINCSQMASDEAYQFRSEAVNSMGGDCLLGCLNRLKGRDNPTCTVMLNIISQWCIDDESIARFIHDLPGPQVRFARFSDVFIRFAEEIKQEFEHKKAKAAGRIPISQKDQDMMVVIEEQLLPKRDAINQRFQPWIDQELQQLQSLSGFDGYNEDRARVSADANLILSYPPSFLVKDIVEGSKQQLMSVRDKKGLCTVIINQVACRYAYSLPNGKFNLCSPEMKLKQPGNFSGVNYFKYCEDNNIQPVLQPAAEGTTIFEGLARESGGNILQIVVRPNRPDKYNIVASITLSCPQDANLNVKLPITNLKYESIQPEEKQAFAFHKIDPTKAEWCTGNQFNLVVKCKEKGRSY